MFSYIEASLDTCMAAAPLAVVLPVYILTLLHSATGPFPIREVEDSRSLSVLREYHPNSTRSWFKSVQ